jgi:hypothetical protein
MNVEIHPLPPKKNYIMRMCYNEIITNYMIIAGLYNKKKVSVDQSKYLYYIEVEFIYFKIRNFPNLCSNIPAFPAYGVYISQLIRYTRASSNYSDFLKRHLHLRNRLLDQGYKKIRLIRSLKKFIFQYQDLVKYIPSPQKRL